MGLCLHLPFSGCIEVNLDESVLCSIMSVFELIVCCEVYFVFWSALDCILYTEEY